MFKVIGYNARFLDEFVYVADSLPAEAIPYFEYDKDLGKTVYNVSKTIVNTPVSKSSLIPGVGLDCIGVVISVLALAGVCKLPSFLQRDKVVSSQREGEWDSLDINKKLQRFLFYFLTKCCILPNAYIYPVFPYSYVLPGDIIASPYIVQSRDGSVLFPHTFMIASYKKLITANFSLGFVKLMDIDTYGEFQKQMLDMAQKTGKDAVDGLYVDYQGRKVYFMVYRYYYLSEKPRNYDSLMVKIRRALL